MADEIKTILRIVLLLVVGLLPASLGLVLEPTRAMAAVAAGSGAMAIGFVVWTERIAAEARRRRRAAGAMEEQVAELEESMKTLSVELRDAKMNDPGTGLLNRTALLRRLEEAITRDARLGKSLVVLLVDVEGFKAYNAQRGRIEGDALLKRVARALEDATRGTDAVGRLGGDEFGVVLTECADPKPAMARVVASLKREGGGDQSNTIYVAIGAVTIEDPSRGVDVQELLQLAESAIASVRGSGGSPCARRTLPSAMRRAAAASVVIE